jgi:rsbT antagonist protein RsbS
LLDISSLEVVDSFIGRMMANIASMSRVLDAETVLVGMQPAVAITLVELGLSLQGVHTALNVDRGMQLLRKRLAARNGFDGTTDDGLED